MSWTNDLHTSFAWRRGAIGLLLCVVCLATGCNTLPLGQNAVAARDLPYQFRAANQSMQPPIDLSVLASKSINSDLVYPGDVLDITLITGAEERQPDPLPYRVNADGTLDLPLIGKVAVSGLTLTGAEEQIRQQSVARQIYRDPMVSVLMNERQTDKVRVVGAVNEPGTYELPRAGSDLLAAIVAAKGLTEKASQSIEIRHRMPTQTGIAQASFESGEPTTQSVHVDLVEAMSGTSNNLDLRDGSVVMVKEHRPQPVYVLGLVRLGGEFDIPKDQPLRVTQAIALAGGRKSEFADRVHVTRFVEGQPEPILVRVSLREASRDRESNLVLLPGDVVSVEETPMTFTVDFLRNFLRIGISSVF